MALACCGRTHDDPDVASDASGAGIVDAQAEHDAGLTDADLQRDLFPPETALVEGMDVPSYGGPPDYADGSTCSPAGTNTAFSITFPARKFTWNFVRGGG